MSFLESTSAELLDSIILEVVDKESIKCILVRCRLTYDGMSIAVDATGDTVTEAQDDAKQRAIEEYKFLVNEMPKIGESA